MKLNLLFTLILAGSLLMAQAGGPPPAAQQGLPPGIGLSTSGMFSGTPTTPGTWQFNVQVCDSGSPQQCVTTPSPLAITISPAALTINPVTLPNGKVGVPYPATPITATGGVTPYTWSIAP